MPKRGVPSEEFIYQNSQGPPVNSSGVALVLDYLGGEIFGGAT